MVIEITFMDLIGASIAIGAACYATWYTTVQREVRPLKRELAEAIASPCGWCFARGVETTPPTLRTGNVPSNDDDDPCISSVDVAITDDGAAPDTPSPASLADTVRPPSRR